MEGWNTVLLWVAEVTACKFIFHRPPQNIRFSSNHLPASHLVGGQGRAGGASGPGGEEEE